MAKQSDIPKQPEEEIEVVPEAEEGVVAEEEPTIEEPSELDKAIQEKEEFKAKYLRAIADYQNMERRMFDEKQEITRRSKSEVITQLLPFLDNLDKAEVFIKDVGLKMVKDQFVQTLESMGVKEVELLGKEFDPHTAEAIEVVDGDKDNIVVEVARKAYNLNGKLVQHGQVKVSKVAEKSN